MVYSSPIQRSRRPFSLASVFSCILFTFISFVSFTSTASAELVTLHNSEWSLQLNTDTLALQTTAAGHKQSVTLSHGVKANTTSGLVSTSHSASWQWPNRDVKVTATLQGKDLTLSFTTGQPQTLTWLNQSSDPLRLGMILPLGEGQYLPTGNTTWNDFLNTEKEFNTTQDLSLPLWGLDYGTYTLNWLLTNPFNNTLTFSGERDLKVSHEFTPLNLDEPFTTLLNLGDADLLASAKRYRKHLKEEQKFISLAEKIKKVPDTAKLEGAPQIYIWGSHLLSVQDVEDWKGLVTALKSDKLKSLTQFFDKDTRKALAETKAGQMPYKYNRSVIVNGLETAVSQLISQNASHPKNDHLSVKQRAQQVQQRKAWVKEHLGAYLKPASTWGQGLSAKTLAQFKKAGLKRLWIGFDGWDTGFYRPEVIKQAIAAGYLVSPYDSYNTALPPSVNNTWETAHMGADVFKKCGYIKRDGSARKGFKGDGVYVEPGCAEPFFEQRTAALKKAFGANSWFLDADATGMVFENYRQDQQHSQADDARARNNRLQTMVDTYQFPVGSEDGHITTVAGISFAQGLQSRGFGWTDKDMRKNSQSPYYLGRWWPDNGPAIFFKPAAIKDKYKTVTFDHRYRLPLAQAVIGDSVITTDHWLMDSLKFKDIAAERELTQLLYMVPPLYHLNQATMSKRLPIIAHQDAFFRPLHKRLATVALTEFRYLNKDKSVQETVFADGSRMIANFSDKAFHQGEIKVPVKAIQALLPDGKTSTYTSIL